MMSEEVLNIQTKMSQFKDRERTALSVIIDIGTVTKVSPDGNNASVQSFRTIEGMPIEYNDVEVLYPAGLHMSLGNALVLIVAPCSCIPDTQLGEPVGDAYPYDGRGMKAIPLANNSDASKLLLMNYSKDSLVFSSDAYSFNFLKNAVSIITNNEIKAEVTQDAIVVQWKNSLSFAISDNEVSEVFYDANGKTTELVSHLFDGTEVTYRGANDVLDAQYIIDPASYSDWKSVETRKADGTISIKHGNDLNISIGADGSIKYAKGNRRRDLSVSKMIAIWESTCLLFITVHCRRNLFWSNS